MTSFNFLETFYVDPNAVNKSPKVFLTSVVLYFKSKPKATNNKSGVLNPGVSLYICAMKNSKPDPSQMYQPSFSRLDYQDITYSPDASSPSVFKFKAPTLVPTGQYYGVVVLTEDPDYELWTSKQGEHLVGTNTISPGPSGKNDGYFYTPTNSDVLNEQASVDLKFKVNIAKFIGTEINAKIVPYEYEFLDYNNISNTFFGGEYVFQKFGNTSANNTAYKSGTLRVNAASNTIIGVGTSFNTVLSQNNMIVITDGTVANTIVRKIQFVTNSTSITLEVPPSFSNTAARYFVSPIAKVYYPRYTQNNIVLIDSTANSSVRFVNNSVRYLVISTGGEGYSNADYITVSGGGSTLNAVANVTTDGNGTIVNINWSNNGLGFSTSPTVAITSSNGSITNAATLVCNTSMYGSLLVGEETGTYANITNVNVYNVDQFRPQISLNTPIDTTIDMTHLFTYKDGSSYYTNTIFTETTDLGAVNEVTKYSGIIMSRSLEVINTSGLYNNDKSAVFKAKLKTVASNNNLFLAPSLSSDKLDIFTYWNNINNDATNEHTAQGNAVVKHISTKINFANNKFAEDIRVYLTAYKPANTDIKVYARIHNSADIEAFDDKNWSPLELKEGVGLISSKTDSKSYVELGYGFPQYPTGGIPVAGVVSTTFSSATLNATGSDYVTDLAANDLIKIYSPIFPQNYQVGVVSSVTNTSQIILKAPIANNDLSGAGFKIDKLSIKNVGFNNIQNDNVVRYYSSSMVEYDSYDTFQLKIVLLSDSRSVVPRVDDIRSIGVSA